MAQRVRFALLSVVATSALACGGAASESAAPAAPAAAEGPAPAASAPVAVETASKPADLAALRAREVTTGLTKQVVASPDGTVNVEVSAAAKPTAKIEGDVVELTIPVGTRSPVSCDVYKSRIDSAGSVARMVADVRKNVKLTSAKATDLKVVGGVPVLFVETEYTKESKDPKATAQQVGAFKIAVRAADTQTFVCSHNDLGYVETFKKLVTELATGLKAPKVDAQYVQIDALRMGDTLVGFKETRVRTDAKTGGRYIDTFDSRLLGKGVAELSGEDETSQAIVDKAGNLAAEKYMLLADGDVALDVTLRRKAGKEYTVDGKQKGAPVKGTFKAQKEITTPYSRAAAVKKLVAGKDEQAQFSSYAPRVELSAALEETYKKQDGVLVVDSGALGTAKVKVDAEGLPEKAEATGQGTSLLVERIEARGTP